MDLNDFEIKIAKKRRTRRNEDGGLKNLRLQDRQAVSYFWGAERSLSSRLVTKADQSLMA
jgi:hypothetical protein